jgi:hypothetical protein
MITKGRLNLSLPTSANSVNVAIFDVRGRMLFERNVTMISNVASLALPKSIVQNQAAILRIETNSGFNMTKRILIK